MCNEAFTVLFYKVINKYNFYTTKPCYYYIICYKYNIVNVYRK